MCAEQAKECGLGLKQVVLQVLAAIDASTVCRDEQRRVFRHTWSFSLCPCIAKKHGEGTVYDPLWKNWVRPFEAKTEREVVLYPLLLELLRLELGDERAADAQYYTMVVSRMDPGGYEAKHVETWDIARAYLLEGGNYRGGQFEATLGPEPGVHLARYDARAPHEVKPVTRGA